MATLHDDVWNREYPHSRTMLDTLPMGIVVQDMAGRITQCNPAAESILGLSLDQMRGVTSIDPRWQAIDENGDVFPGDCHPAMQALRTRQSVADVVMGVFNPKAGTRTWINVNATPIRDRVNGEVLAVYSIFQDVSERRRMEARLVEKQAQYRVAIETSIDGFLVIDPTGKIIEANDAYARLSGYTRDELLQMSVMDLEANEASEEARNHVQEARRQGHELYETVHRTKAGHAWPVEVSTTYSTVGGGRWFAFLRDITRRKAYEVQRGQFEALVKSSQDAIIGIALDGTVTSWNAGAESLFGYSFEEVIGKPLNTLAPADRTGEEQEILARVRQGEKVSSIDTVRLRKDGSAIDVSVSISPIRDASGKIVGASKIARDVTNQKRAERIQAARIRLMKYASTHSLHALLVATLDEACSLTGSAIGFYHFLDRDQKTLSLQAWSTRTTREYCTAGGAGSHYNIDEAGIWVDCIRQRAAVIHNDYASVKTKRGLPPGHAALIRELVVPVFRNDLIVAILGVGNKDIHYSDLDVQTVNQFADMAWDLAETRRIEEALHESEERFQRTMEATHDGIWDWNTEDDSGYCSPSFYTMLGYEPGEFGMAARSWWSLIHPDDASRVLKANQDCIAGSVESFEIEYRMRAKDGSWKWILGRGKAFTRNASGRALRMVGTHVDITGRKEAEIRINYLAYHDPLTGLPNRTLFFDRFSQAIALAKRDEKRVALFFLDLDGFKAVNDQQGHDAGDMVLKTVAERLLAAIRGIDTVARLGGDEFAVILGQLEDPQEAGLVAAKLLNLVAQPIRVAEDFEAAVSASIGIGLHPVDGSEMDILLGKADVAMYQSKERGGNRFTFWDDSKQEHSDNDTWIQMGAEHFVGFDEIDEQHRKLIDLGNQLQKLIRTGAPCDQITRQLAELIEYVKVHFITESRLMERYRYPGKRSHDRAHQGLLLDASHFENLLNRGGDLFVLRSIRDWLVNHIQTEDKVLGQFLNKQERVPD